MSYWFRQIDCFDPTENFAVLADERVGRGRMLAGS